MERTKVLAAFLLAGIVFMSSGFISRLLFTQEELTENAYVIVVDDGADAVAEEAPPEPEIETLRACTACHNFEAGAAHKVGPNLWDIVDADIAPDNGFNYSEVLETMEGEWTYAALNGFLANPRNFAPGTKMSYAGMRSIEDRADLIVWMRSLSDSPVPLPE